MSQRGTLHVSCIHTVALGTIATLHVFPRSLDAVLPQDGCGTISNCGLNTGRMHAWWGFLAFLLRPLHASLTQFSRVRMLQTFSSGTVYVPWRFCISVSSFIFMKMPVTTFVSDRPGLDFVSVDTNTHRLWPCTLGLHTDIDPTGICRCDWPLHWKFGSSNSWIHLWGVVKSLRITEPWTVSSFHSQVERQHELPVHCVYQLGLL